MKIATFIVSSLALSILLLFSGVGTQLSAQSNLNPLLPIEPTVEDPDVVIDLLVLTDETAIQVIDLLEQLTDKIILRRQDLPATKINFNSRGTSIDDTANGSAVGFPESGQLEYFSECVS